MALSQERQSLEFAPSALTKVLYGRHTSKLLEIWGKLAASPETQNSPAMYTYSREELFEHTYRALAFVIKNFDIYKLDSGLVWDMMKHFGPTPLDTHFVMFRQGIRALGTAQQRNHWLALIDSHQIFGCYAQTELGHGSDVKNLETVASYEKNSQEFVINSPTIASTKFWAAGLGLTATHCLLFAKLYSDGVVYGIHPFIVQIRDLETYSPMPGVEIGDVGPKMGWKAVDNGFLRLHNVRVPLDNMLGKYGRLRKDGTYFAPPFARLRYFVMLEVRIGLIRDIPRHLAKALTIAIRYSIVRRQFLDENGQERKILDYPSQQHRLFGPLASCYAMYSTSFKMLDLGKLLKHQLREGNLSFLKEVHALAAGLKALFSDYALAGINECRESCGGQGISNLSGLPEIYVNFAPFVTLEGDNSVLYLQCASFIVKCLRDGEALTGQFEYLNYIQNYVKHTSFVKQISDFINVFVFEEMIRVRAAYIAKRTIELIKAEEARGLSYMQIFYERAQPDLVEMAKAHLHLFVFLQFKDYAMAQTGKTKKVLIQLCQLFAGNYIANGITDLYECGFLTNGTTEKLLKQKISLLLNEVRKSAIGLVDAFAFTDNCLNSSLGAYDGNVYERILKWTRDAKLDVGLALQNFNEHLKSNFNPKL